MPKYSILIPAYNVEEYIEATLVCILEQPIDDFEIIIANDGSTDNTSKICKYYSDKYENVRVFDKKNEGLMKTRFFLYEKAVGKYCICCDADDTWEKNTLEVIDNYIEAYKPEMLIFSYYLWEANCNQKKCKNVSIKEPTLYSGKKLSELWEILLCTDEINSLWSKVILSTKIPSKWDIPIVAHGEDKLQLLNIMDNIKSALYIPTPLYNYRIDNSSMTRKFDFHYFDDVIKTRKIVWNVMLERNMLSVKTINKLGCDLLELYITFLIGLHRSEISNSEKDAIAYKYLNEDIFVRLRNDMTFRNIPLWHKVMLILLKCKQIKLINILYDINHFLKGIK